MKMSNNASDACSEVVFSTACAHQTSLKGLEPWHWYAVTQLRPLSPKSHWCLEKPESKWFQPLSALHIWNASRVVRRMCCSYSEMVNYTACATRSLLMQDAHGFMNHNHYVNGCSCVWCFCQGWGVARGFESSAMQATDLGTWETFGVERPLETARLAGFCPTRPASMRLRDHRLGREWQRLLCLLWQLQCSICCSTAVKALPGRDKAPDAQKGHRLLLYEARPV